MERTILIMAMACAFVVMACDGPAGAEDGPAADVTIGGAETFSTYCKLCHGTDGRLGINGAKDLTLSALTREEMIILVRNGKGVMAPYGNVLTGEEIENVVDHVRSLRASHPE